MAVGYVWALRISFERFETLTCKVKIPLRSTGVETYDACAKQVDKIILNLEGYEQTFNLALQVDQT
jgi:hypothetical protein